MKSHLNTLLLITAFLSFWCLLWAFEHLIALNICYYSFFFNSNCYVIVTEKNESYMIQFLRKKVLEQNVKVSLLNPGQRIPVNTLYIWKNNKRFVLQSVKYQLYYKKNSFRHIFKDLTKVCSNLHSQLYFENTQSDEPPLSACLRA